MEGKETELDKTIIEAIKDPLTHLVRNAVDHGIEPPERARRGRQAGRGTPAPARLPRGRPGHHRDHRRRRRHRPRAGQQKAVAARADRAPDQLAAAERPRARQPDLPARLLDRREGHQRLRPRRRHGRGARPTSRRSAARSTSRAALGRRHHGQDQDPADAGDHPGADRHAAAATATRSRRSACSSWCASRASRRGARSSSVHGAPVYRLRGNLLPLVYLDQRARQRRRPTTARRRPAVNIVVLQADDRQFGLVVDGINDTEEIVVKPLASSSRASAPFAGATIMGDGRSR